jgi:flagellar hook-associated protein 2
MVSIVTNGGLTLSTSQSTSSSSDPTSTGLTLSDYVSSDQEMTRYTNQIDATSTSISTNSTLISSYQNMKSLLTSLQTAALNLAGKDSQSSTADIFSSRAASLSTNNSTAASTILSASVAAGTSLGTHTVVVQQVATAEQIAGTEQSSSSSALNYSGNFIIGAGSSSATIALTSGMALSDIVSAINNTTANSGVSASIVEVSSSQFVLEVTAASTGQAISMSDPSSSGVLTGLGLVDSGGAAKDVITAAQSAILSVDGISNITRTSNSINDIISGVTLNLSNANASTTLTLGVTPNTADVSTAITSFVSAYNSWESFVLQNETTSSSGTASSTAVLFGDSSLRSASTLIGSALSSLVNNSSLGAVGITFNSDMTLSINSASLSTALSDHFSTVASLFEYQATTTNGTLHLSSDQEATYQGTLDFNITASSSGISSVVVTNDTTGATVPFTISGSQLIGASTGAAAGLVFNYTGNSSASIQVSTSQGIGDAIYQISNEYANGSTGEVQKQITSLTNQNTTLNSTLSTLDSESTSYYNYLLTQYGIAVSSISSANQTANLLQQMIASGNSSSG